MGGFEPVVIEPREGSYAIRQGSEQLFVVPALLFETFDADRVFPPSWKALDEPVERGVRYLLWHPPTGELLMSAPPSRPPRLAQAQGHHPFRAYLQAYWFPDTMRFLLRAYWNPASSREKFDREARVMSLATQLRFLERMQRLRPPAGWYATLNVVSRYQRMTGLEVPSTPAPPSPPSPVLRAVLTPPTPRGDPRVDDALRWVGEELSGSGFPTLDADHLLWVEVLRPESFDTLCTLLTRLGLDHRREALSPH